MDQEVEHFVPGYPPPSPQVQSPDEIFQRQDFCDLDNRAREAPKHLVDNFDQLVTYLVEGATSDLAKVRAIFSWLAAQPVVNQAFPKIVKPDTPKAWLKRIKYDRFNYAQLFTILCRQAGVPCVIIPGCSKGAGFQVGRKDQVKVNSRWNAVHVQGSWQLVNVSWALISADGLGEEEWKPLEVNGESVVEQEIAKKEVRQELDEFWFLVKPEDMTAFCHPKDARWQLLECPWSDEDFTSTPLFATDFFQSEWELVTENKGVMVANQGACKITFVHATNGVREASLSYVLLYHSGDKPEDPIHERPGTERYVLVDSRRGEKSLVTRLPSVGNYRLQVAGLLDSDVTYLGEFRIECPSVQTQPSPFPEGFEEIGYSEKAASVGLEQPSHEDGIVHTKPGEKVTLSFCFSKDQPQPSELRATLTHNTLTEDKLKTCTEVKRTDNDFTVVVKVPKDKVAEFGLSIEALAAAEGDGEPEDQAAEINYQKVIQYILTQDSKLTFPKEKAIIKKSTDLLTSIKNFDVAQFFQLRAAHGDTMGPLIRTRVDVFLAEVNKVKAMRRRELEEALNSPEISRLEKALHDYEVFPEVNEDIVQQARATLGLLTALKSEDDVPRLEAALKTAYDIDLIRNSNVQRVEDTLMTCYDKDLTDVYYKRNLDTVISALTKVDRSCAKVKLCSMSIFRQLEQLKKSLKEIKEVTEKVSRLKSWDLNQIARPRSGQPSSHVQSVLMATFILLGEKEADLWKWDVIRNLMERRAETGVAVAMAKLDIDSLTSAAVGQAESHVRSCDYEVLQAENPNAGLFYKWVQGVVAERRARDAMRNRRNDMQP